MAMDYSKLSEASRAPEAPMEPVSYVKDVNSSDFEEKVLNGKGKVLVDFSAVWCGPCHALAPVLEQVAREHLDEVTIYSCNIDACPDLAGRYSIYSVPSLLLFIDGKYARMTVGAIPKATVEAFLEL